MTVNLYTVPVIHLSSPRYEVPKYLPHRFNAPIAGLENVSWAWETYLLEDFGLIIADVTSPQDNLLRNQADVLAVPPLDNSINNNSVRDTVRNYLEAASIPGSWINTGMSYRAILRIVLGLFYFHNRLVVRVQRRFWDGTITLDTTVGQLTLEAIQQARNTADDLGLDYSAVTSATTIRQLLLGVGQQFSNRSLKISGAGISLDI